MENCDLLANPFAVLGVSTRDDREAIARAVEARLAGPSADEDRVRRAQRILMAPKPRLEAEASWLIGLAPSRARTILSALDGNDLESLASALPALPALTRANVAAHLAYRRPNEAIAGTLIAAYGEIDRDELTGVINAERALAGLPRVAADLMEEALGAVRERHLEAAQAALTADPHPGRLMTRLVEGWLDAEGRARDFLEALAARYDRWSAPILGQIEEHLDAASDRLRAEPKHGASLEEIVRALAKWDEYSQPCQLLSRQNLVDEPRSKKLAQKLRGLALWLGNERQDYRRALVITKALLITFPELPDVDATLQKDVNALEGLVRQAGEVELLAGLSRAVGAARACSALAREIERGDFGPRGRGAAGQLYTAFAKAVRRAREQGQPDLPWQALRQLALELHHERKETRAALHLTVALLAFNEAHPSAVLAERLRGDEATFRRQLEERPNRVIRRRVGWTVAAGIIGMIGLANLDTGPTPPRAASRAVVSSPAGGGSLTEEQIFGTPTKDDFSHPSVESPNATESPPPVGSGQLLTTNQIRYCLFQGERLEAFRPVAATNSQIDWLNHLIGDWNRRCGDYRYRKASMQAVQRDLGLQKDRLRREGRALAAAGGFAPSDTGQAPPPTADAQPLDRWWQGDPLAALAPPPTAGARVLSPATFLADAREVQRRLAALGYYAATIDGVWGPGSRRALAEFKRRAGLPADADWDRPTQDRLFQATDR